MKPLKCHKCGYSWETKTTHLYVTCPNCLCKVAAVTLQEMNDKLEKKPGVIVGLGDGTVKIKRGPDPCQ